VSESNLKAIIENTDATIYSLDRDFRYITFNRQLQNALKEVYGLDIKKGDHVYSFLKKLDPEEALSWEKVYSKALSGEIVKFEKEFNIGGFHNYTSFSIHPIWENNNVIGLSCFATDITKEKILEKKIIDSEAQIRNFAKHLNRTKEEENAHIARELHDELGQQLAGIKMGIASIKKLSNTDVTREERMTAIIKDVDNTIHSLRKIATELRPGILDTLGLIPSIEWMVNEFEKKTVIKCHTTLNVKQQKFEKDISICFFRICQESLTNISKHAQAKKVTVKVDQNENELILSISDNGKGIADEKLDNPFSMGLLGMRERAKIIGAQLTIDSRSSGTTVQLIAKI
ncbi:MAG: PAS domain S-box protein, partial [Bacteroidetes bacterium]|nr:PAS domain S-box protein [Bacteroidota bacterium]